MDSSRSGGPKTGHRGRLRSRFLTQTDETLPDEALLELLLGYAIPRRDVRPLAKELIKEHGSLSTLLSADLESLCKSKGVTEYVGVLLKLVDFIKEQRPKTPTQKTGTSEPRSPSTKPKKRVPSKEKPAGGSRAEAPPTQMAKTQDALPFAQPEPAPPEGQPAAPASEKPPRRPPKRARSGIIAKAVLKEAIHFLPKLPDTESIEKAKEYLVANLHHSSEQTRHRFANYITQRMFPDGTADRPIREFARKFPDSRDLRDVAFYRFCKVEDLVQDVVTDLLLPNVGAGKLDRDRLRDYLRKRYPESRSIKDCAQAIIEALTGAQVTDADRTTIKFAYREIPTASFAFVLHSEFLEPGMYEIEALRGNRLVKTMLWNPDSVVPALYGLRNHGIISKVSEIDRFCQFTTRWSLDELVDHL